MRFISPDWLLLLFPVVLLALLYALMQARRSRYAVRFANLDLLDKVAPVRPGWRRHLPAAAFWVMLAMLTVGFARPTAEVLVPRERATIVVALDVSTSMRADDVEPTRFAAAQAAAREFVAGLPERFNVGLVSFSAQASVVVPPTVDRAVIRTAIEQLTTDGGTAIGDAVFSALDAISALDARAGEDPPPAHVVLLSDGFNTTGRTPDEAADEASASRVPVSTIAYGTPDGVVVAAGQTIPVPVDGPTLRRLAETTGGRTYEAASGAELRQVYADIGSSIGYQRERREIWPWFVGFAMIAALGSALTSLLWFSRIP